MEHTDEFRTEMNLSRREREAVQWINAGCTQKEAAFEMNIAHSTLRVLLMRALRKLGQRAMGYC